jgi:NAD(P)H-dependent flavin oxidoreductase YrpB (nitropropane dioxygenase family)
MGTRFLLTTDSAVARDVKQVYLDKGVADTVVTTEVDGVPHRVLRTAFVDELLKSRALGRMTRAVRNAVAFQKLSGTPWKDVVTEGLAMRKNAELSLSQLVMAANTPMLLKAAMVDGRPDLGVMASGQVVGVIDDLPSCQELIDRIVAEASKTLADLTTLERLA